MFDGRRNGNEMTPIRIALAVVLLAPVVRAQGQEELIAGLKSPIASERAAALVGLGKLKNPEVSLLEIVAGSLVDEAEDVRLTAAYSLASVAGKVGCELGKLDDCKLLKDVLEATPRAVKKVPPRYPDEAKRKRIEGAVRMEFVVTPDGRVERLHVIDGPPLIRDAAMEAVKQWKYEPAKRSGTAVPFAMLFTMTFRLN